MINTVFYFAESKNDYLYNYEHNQINGRTICFVPSGDGKTGSIYKNGLQYGKIEEQAIADIESAINNVQQENTSLRKRVAALEIENEPAQKDYTITYELNNIASTKMPSSDIAVVSSGTTWQDDLIKKNGYSLQEIVVSDDKGNGVGYTIQENRLEVPNITSNIVVSASAIPSVTSVYTIDYSHITNCIKTAESPTEANSNNDIVITLTVNSGYKFTNAPYVLMGTKQIKSTNWQDDTASISISKPSADLVVYANGEKISQNATLTIIPDVSDATVSFSYTKSGPTVQNNVVTVPQDYSGTVTYNVTKEGYQTYSGIWKATSGSKTDNVNLDFIGIIGSYGTPNQTNTQNAYCWDILGYRTTYGQQLPPDVNGIYSDDQREAIITGPKVTQDQFNAVTYEITFGDRSRWTDQEMESVTSSINIYRDSTDKLCFSLIVPEYSIALDSYAEAASNNNGVAYRGDIHYPNREVCLTVTCGDGSSTYWLLTQTSDYGLGSSSIGQGFEVWNINATNAFESIEIYGRLGTTVSINSIQNGYVDISKSGPDAVKPLWFILRGKDNYPDILNIRDYSSTSASDFSQTLPKIFEGSF